MKHRLFRIYAALIIFAAILAAGIYIYLPAEINVLEGKERIFDFKLPIGAQINSEKKGVIYLNNKKIQDNQINVNLNEPFSLQLSENDNSKIEFNLFGIPLKSAKIDTIPNQKLIPVGQVKGIRIFTDGIMVLGTGFVNGSDGKVYEPSKDILKTGDTIIEVNGQEVINKDDLIKILQKNNGEEVGLKIKREGVMLYRKIKPIKNYEDNEYKIGIWVRDSTQGIGTITYYNPNTGYYGALGHGILDIDTNSLLNVKNGKILKSAITHIKKGERGAPGEIMGVIIDTDSSMEGNVIKNSNFGIYGKLNKKFNMKSAIDIGLKEEIKLGRAYIYSDILGNGVEKYEVDIENINMLNYDMSKGMIIKIKDERLLNKTNGIIQGMSGSPIIQDDKIIGAVTHVFVNDPAKGYGIFIENMIKEEKNIL